MIILTGYYHFGVEVEALRNATTTNNPYVNIGARGEANSWNAKVNIAGRKFALENAVGVLSDKFGFWYIVKFCLEKNRTSFLVVKEDNSERYRFEMEKKKGGHEFWGTRTSLDLSPAETITSNCLALESAEMTPNVTGVPERMLVPPNRDSRH